MQGNQNKDTKVEQKESHTTEAVQVAGKKTTKRKPKAQNPSNNQTMGIGKNQGKSTSQTNT
jgi:hypothetical protein